MICVPRSGERIPGWLQFGCKRVLEGCFECDVVGGLGWSPDRRPGLAVRHEAKGAKGIESVCMPFSHLYAIIRCIGENVPPSSQILPNSHLLVQPSCSLSKD